MGNSTKGIDHSEAQHVKSPKRDYPASICLDPIREYDAGADTRWETDGELHAGLICANSGRNISFSEKKKDKHLSISLLDPPRPQHSSKPVVLMTTTAHNFQLL